MTTTAILNEYSTKHALKLARLSMRRQEVCAAIPEYAALLENLNRLRAAAAKAAVLGTDVFEAKQALDKFIRQANRQQPRLLTKHGFPEDYLDPEFECPKCRDTGLVGGENRIPCECMRRHLPESPLGGLDKAPCFDNFDEGIIPEGRQRESAVKLKQYLIDFCDSFPNCRKRNFVLKGETGMGKSFMLGCTATRLARRGFTARLITAYRLHELFREQHLGGGVYMPALVEADFLAIDDLGTEPIYKNITIEYLFSLLNERSINKKSTAVATNLSPEALMQRYGERITSRLFDKSTTRLFSLSGKDLRLFNAKA